MSVHLPEYARRLVEVDNRGEEILVPVEEILACTLVVIFLASLRGVIVLMCSDRGSV